MTVNTIHHSYDADDNLLSIDDANSSYTFTYDALNRVKHEAGVWSTTLDFGYDADSRRSTVTDNFGGVITSTYDDLDRLTRRTLAFTRFALFQTCRPNGRCSTTPPISRLALR